MTAGILLGRAATIGGLNAVMSEIHGMSQRGGVVTVDLRIGEAFGPIIPQGAADLILGFEAAETLRAVKRAGKDTVVVMSTERIVPPGVSIGDATYPDTDAACSVLRAQGARLQQVDARGMAESVGNPLSSNVVLLGAAYASGVLPMAFEILEEAVRDMFPQKTWESNLGALRLGAGQKMGPNTERKTGG